MLLSKRGRITGLYYVVLCNTPVRSQKLEFLSDTSEFINSAEIKDTLWHLKVCWILVKMNFIQVELGLGLLIAKTDLPCLFKRLRGPAPMHPRGVSGYLKLGGQVVNATRHCHHAAARRRLLYCQKLGRQLPTLPTCHLRPCTLRV